MPRQRGQRNHRGQHADPQHQPQPRYRRSRRGNFLIAWDGVDGAGLNQGGIRAQQFTAAGVKVGAEFFVNTNLVADQGQVSLHQPGADGFLATWTDFSRDGGGTGIRRQVFDGAGAKVGGEFLVNTTTAGDQPEAPPPLWPRGRCSSPGPTAPSWTRSRTARSGGSRST